MRAVLIYLFILLIPAACQFREASEQHPLISPGTLLTQAQFQQLQSAIIHDLPLYELPRNVLYLYVSVCGHHEDRRIFLIGQQMGYKYKVLYELQGLKNTIYNPRRAANRYEQGRLYLASAGDKPQSLYMCAVYEWKNRQPLPIGDGDKPVENQKNLQRAALYLDRGDLPRALACYQKMTGCGSLLPQGCQVLKKAQQLSLPYRQQKQYDKACRIFQTAMAFAPCRMLLEEVHWVDFDKRYSLLGLTKKEVQGMLRDYGLLLFFTGDYQGCIAINQQLLRLDEEQLPAYLDMADAYWEAGDEQEARDFYEIYARKMSDKGLEVPFYVSERIFEAGN